MMTFLESWAKFADYMGLSDYEAKIYIALVENHPLGARQIGLLTGVPRTKVYGTIKHLLKYGLVLKVPGRPQQYAPVSPNKVTRETRMLMASRSTDFKALVARLSEEFNLPKDRSPEWVDLWFSEDSEHVTRLVGNFILDSDPLVIITRDTGLQMLYNGLSNIMNTLGEKETVRICTSMSPESLLCRELQEIISIDYIEFEPHFVYMESEQNFILAKVSPRGDEFNWAFFGSGERLSTLFAYLPFFPLKYVRGGEPGSKSIAFPPGMGEKTPLHHQDVIE